MSHVSLTPYIVEEADGTDLRIVIPVNTPAALVLVESRLRGRFTVKGSNRDGVPIAIDLARQYVRAHPGTLDPLYERLALSLGPS